MTVHELIKILEGMPQHIEAIVQNIDNETTHRVQGVHVKQLQGVVAINVKNLPYKIPQN